MIVETGMKMLWWDETVLGVAVSLIRRKGYLGVAFDWLGKGLGRSGMGLHRCVCVYVGWWCMVVGGVVVVVSVTVVVVVSMDSEKGGRIVG